MKTTKTLNDVFFLVFQTAQEALEDVNKSKEAAIIIKILLSAIKI